MHKQEDKSYKYSYRYCTQKQLCDEHGITPKTIERWIAEAKDKGQTIPGRIKIPGVRNYIWDPIIFHDVFLILTLLGTYRNEYEKTEHVVILNNLQTKRGVRYDNN